MSVSEGSINLTPPFFDVPKRQSRWTVVFNGTSIKGDVAVGFAEPPDGGNIMDAQKTGKLINFLRSKKGITQKELATLINVSDKAVSKWERGDGCPDVGILPLLAQTLETDVDSLLNGEITRREITK